MEITVFVPTGEHRIPISGEWCRNMDINTMFKAHGTHYQDEYDIGVIHQFTPPEGAQVLRFEWDLSGTWPLAIPLPKQKVKREGWVNINRWKFDKSHYTSETIYTTKQEALDAGPENPLYITTVRVEWEE
jgi:hypothetical protein